jgi:hypothetical protein
MMCDAVEQRAAVDAEKNENRGRDAGKKYEASGRIQASIFDLLSLEQDHNYTTCNCF